MKARSSLMMTLARGVKRWELTQADAAKRLGIPQSRLNDLLRGRIEKFSLDALVGLGARAQYQVEVRLRKAV